MSRLYLHKHALIPDLYLSFLILQDGGWPSSIGQGSRSSHTLILIGSELGTLNGRFYSHIYDAVSHAVLFEKNVSQSYLNMSGYLLPPQNACYVDV